jgi:hypothetical protein
MTNLMQCIQKLESIQTVPKVAYESLMEAYKDTEADLIEARTELAKRQIVLDTSKDPDPFGLHRMSLSYRLRCMGWPEGLS